MILNRKNQNKTKKKKEIKYIEEEEEENEEENEEEEEDYDEKDLSKIKRQKIKKKKHSKEEYEEEEEEEDSDERIKSKIKKEKSKIPEDNKKLYLIIISSIIILLFVLIIIFLIKRNNNNEEISQNNLIETNSSSSNNTSNENNNAQNPNGNNEENKPKEENKEDPDKERITNEMKEKYNQEGFLNIIKFNKENILKQEYKTEEMNSKPNQIHINIGFTDVNINTYIKHISSILKNADKEKTCLHIHMMDAGEFNYDTFKKLVKMVDSINTFTEIIVYNANQALKDFNIRSDAVDKFSPEYAKLYAFKVLKDIQKIIFLDADDLMVEKDLEELYELKMDDIYARGIAEDPSIKYEMDWYDKYILDKSHYINCGVLLVNLELCQRDSLYQKAIDLNNAEFYMKTENPAQDILNVLMRKKIEFFNPKFNKINFYENPADKDDETKWYSYMQQTIKIGEKNNHFYTKEELLQADENPTIIHYYWDKALNKVIVKYEEEKKEYARLNGLDE